MEAAEDSLGRLVELLSRSQRILIFTGAGVSTASGIPDFRGPQGVWTRRLPVSYDEFLHSEESRVEYWDQKLEGWTAFRNARPNDVHQACVTLEQMGRLECVVTQNVDGLHTRAGTTAEKLVELHGTNLEVECQSCGRRSDPTPHFESFRSCRRSPDCECGGFLKPATISFGQRLREEDLERSDRAAMVTDLVVALGSTLSVYPAAYVPLRAASRGIPYVIVNRGPTDHDRYPKVTLRIEGAVEGVFPIAVSRAFDSL